MPETKGREKIRIFHYFIPRIPDFRGIAAVVCMLLYVLLCSWRSVEDASVRLYFSAVSVFVATAHPLCTVAVTWFTQALLVG